MSETFGKYLLEKKLAEGGMAELYLARERFPGGGERHVVIKRILPSHAGDPDYVEFFQHEARLALQLGHPHIPQTFEYGCEDGVHYLALEFVRGENFVKLLQQADALGRRLSPGAVFTIAVHVAGALDHVHSAHDLDGKPLGIIHRDVTPHNVLVGWDGIARLLDFGIARTDFQAFRTRTGIVKGKFAYLAPEEVHRGRDFDHRVDLFALGIVLYEGLTGTPLFRASSDLETVQRLVSAPIPPLASVRPDVPPALGRIVDKLLMRDPDDRYPSALVLVAELEAALRAERVAWGTTQLRREMEALFAPPEPALDISAESLAAFLTPGQRVPAPSEPEGPTEPRPTAGKRASTDRPGERQVIGRATGERKALGRTTGERQALGTADERKAHKLSETGSAPVLDEPFGPPGQSQRLESLVPTDWDGTPGASSDPLSISGSLLPAVDTVGTDMATTPAALRPLPPPPARGSLRTWLIVGGIGLVGAAGALLRAFF